MTKSMTQNKPTFLLTEYDVERLDSLFQAFSTITHELLHARTQPIDHFDYGAHERALSEIVHDISYIMEGSKTDYGWTPEPEEEEYSF